MEQVLEKELLRDVPASWVTFQDACIQRDTDLNSQIEQFFDQLQQHQIVVPQPMEVRDYLDRYTDMIDLVLSVCKKARERFVVPTQLSLELYCDPEIDDEYLALYVRQENYEADILDKIESISAPFDAKLAAKSGWLLVTTDFSPPR